MRLANAQALRHELIVEVAHFWEGRIVAARSRTVIISLRGDLADTWAQIECHFATVQAKC